MKKEITEFYCDVCGKKVKESELRVRYLPVRLFDCYGISVEVKYKRGKR